MVDDFFAYTISKHDSKLPDLVLQVGGGRPERKNKTQSLLFSKDDCVLAKGLQLKISLLANTGTFTEMLINVHCPFK